MRGSRNVNIGGRKKKIYDDVEPIGEKEIARKFLQGAQGRHRQKTTAVYSFARFIRWRKAKGLESDPDLLVSECLEGTARTAIQHLQNGLEYSQSLQKCSTETKIRAYK